MTDKLLPCPFCGAAAEVERLHWAGKIDAYTVFCLNDEDCMCRQYALDTEEQAIAAWNRRTGASHE